MKKMMISVVFAAVTFSAAANAELTVEQHCDFVESSAKIIKKGRVGGMPKSHMMTVINGVPSAIQDSSRAVAELAYRLDVDDMDPFPEIVKEMCLKGHFR